MINSQNALLKEYFGAANTANGFYSLFDEIFSPERLRRIYILKGGPGCGKSTLMKKISGKGLELGYEVENYYCSSSPTSLDGVVIPKLSVAVLDGTAPHTFDPKYPAVCESIVNLGAAWDTNAAKAHNTVIRDLNSKKKSAYGKAYAYLSSSLEVQKIIENCKSQYILYDKLKSFAKRFCEKNKISQESHGLCERVFTDCISCLGKRRLYTFEEKASAKCFVRDFGHTADKLFEALSSELKKRGVSFSVSLSPFEPEKINGIFIEASGISITMYDEKYAKALNEKQIPYKTIGMKRFCNMEVFNENRNDFKLTEKSAEDLFESALRELETAGKLHDETEKHYYSFTDFKIVEKMRLELEKEIFQ